MTQVAETRRVRDRDCVPTPFRMKLFVIRGVVPSPGDRGNSTPFFGLQPVSGFLIVTTGLTTGIQTAVRGQRVSRPEPPPLIRSSDGCSRRSAGRSAVSLAPVRCRRDGVSPGPCSSRGANGLFRDPRRRTAEIHDHDTADLLRVADDRVRRPVVVGQPVVSRLPRRLRLAHGRGDERRQGLRRRSPRGRQRRPARHPPAAVDSVSCRRRPARAARDSGDARFADVPGRALNTAGGDPSAFPCPRTASPRFT